MFCVSPNLKCLKTYYLLRSNNPIYKDLEFESIKIIADNCKNLTEINFSGSFGSRGHIDSERTIRYLVENITENIEKIDLGRIENIDDDDVRILAQRFYELENIQYLCLLRLSIYDL